MDEAANRAAASAPYDATADEQEEKDKAKRTFVWSFVVVAVVVGAYVLLLGRPKHVQAIVNAVEFAGGDRRLDYALRPLGVGESQVNMAVVRSLVFALVWGPLGLVLLWKRWNDAWKAGIGKRLPGKDLGLVFGAGGGAVAVLEKLITLSLLQTSGGQVRFTHWLYPVAPLLVETLAWVKWLLAGTLILLVTAMTVSALTAAIRRGLPDQLSSLVAPMDPRSLPKPGDAPAHLGICCSGGGLRAAGFALGALSRLEQEDEADSASLSPKALKGIPGSHGLLGRAGYLASVSGGGYAAAAWRIAAGVGELPDRPVIGAPDLFPVASDPDAPDRPTKLIRYIQDRRRYLANGPGGLLRSGLVTVIFMVFHFFLLLSLVFALSWPLGRVIVGFPVTGVGPKPDLLENGLGSYPLGARIWCPPVALGVLVGILLLAYVFWGKGKVKAKFDSAIKGLAALAGALAVLLIVLPWALGQFIAYLPNGGGQRFALAGVYAAILAALWRVAEPRLKKVARYLGGLLLAAGLILFALFTMAQAGDTNEVFSSIWVWLGSVVWMVVAFVLFNPDRWSLHGLYRRSLAGTFSTTRNGDTVVPLLDEPNLFDYGVAHGPEPVICCAAARQTVTNTGVKVLSMTFDPHDVTVHSWADNPDPQGNAVYEALSINHAQFQQRLPRSTFGVQLQTLMGAASVSGAAVAPSLGRMDLKSTNALLAAFNARLGVWVPNPAYKGKLSTTPRLVNMFKEMLRVFDARDPNIYATDGGHWENLGLVELIRRRCAAIICIDASGDPPGTYATLKQAVKLAKLECQADIELDKLTFWGPLAITEDGVAAASCGVGKIHYHHEEGESGAGTSDDVHEADFLYIRSVVVADSPLAILRYASGDTKFPNYSTVDQLLTAEEFGHLINLGYDAAGQALKANPGFVRTVLRELKDNPWKPRRAKPSPAETGHP